MHRHLKKYGAVLLALTLIASSVMPVLAEVDGIGPDDDYLLEGVYGEKYGSGHSVPPCVMVEVMDKTMAKQWNIGTWIIMRSAVERSIRSPMILPLLMILLCVSITPLGKPVVPEVYCMLHTSFGRTRAARRAISA